MIDVRTALLYLALGLIVAASVANVTALRESCRPVSMVTYGGIRFVYDPCAAAIRDLTGSPQRTAVPA